MIEVKRFDYKERKFKNGKIVPDFYECFYYQNGNKIAWYDSRESVIYLNSKMLTKDFTKPYFDRMKESKYCESFNELIEFLGIDENTKLSEFLDM